jgi:hypothetical protein
MNKKIINSTIHERFESECKRKSDINELLPTLYEYAKRSPRIVEFGVRQVVSTWALMAAKPNSLTSYDIKRTPQVTEAIEIAKRSGFLWNFVEADTTDVIIPECDMLFIDSLHTYRQLRIDLGIHSPRVRRFIAFHDTVTFANRDNGELNDGKIHGIMPAILEFLENNNWKIVEDIKINNGLMVIERIIRDDH